MTDEEGQKYLPISVYYYSIYNSQLENTLKGLTCLPCLGFKPGTSSYETRKYSFCALL